MKFVESYLVKKIRFLEYEYFTFIKQTKNNKGLLYGDFIALKYIVINIIKYIINLVEHLHYYYDTRCLYFNYLEFHL